MDLKTNGSKAVVLGVIILLLLVVLFFAFSSKKPFGSPKGEFGKVSSPSAAVSSSAYSYSTTTISSTTTIITCLTSCDKVVYGKCVDICPSTQDACFCTLTTGRPICVGCTQDQYCGFYTDTSTKPEYEHNVCAPKSLLTTIKIPPTTTTILFVPA